LLQFAQSDEEIAAIISHQLAHNARKHVRTNKIIGGLGGILVGAMGFAGDIGLALLSGGSYATSGFTQLGWAAGNAMAGGMSTNQFQQADKDSLYVMASAGYGIDNVPVFWQRVQELNEPEGIDALRNSHPFLPERSLAMEAAQKEIKEKIQNGNSPYALNF
jgi:predicted Zn-dependent protease